MEEGLDEWLDRVLGGVDCVFGALIYMYSSGPNIFAACAGSRLVIAIGLEVVLRVRKWGRWGNMEEGLDEWLIECWVELIVCLVL